ncbi:MAG: DUF58 domain-containing protein [Phycisphaeraceae bacterium]
MAKTLRKIEPKRLMAVSRMELVARQAVEGVLAGRHPSPFHGSSVEYADHRPYTIGDEIRSLDWKLLAKTDKHYVKLFEDQTNLRCNILLDTSRSMSFRGTAGDAQRLSKCDYAAHLAAALGYLMLRQNDAVGLAMFDHQLRHFLPPRSTATHFRHMLERLETTPPHEQSNMGPVMHALAGRLKRRGLVLLLSDLLDDTDAMLHALGHLRHRGHEVIVFHIMDPDELSFPYDRLTRFKDIEGQGTVVANPANVRKQYMERLDAFLNKVKRGCHERDADYVLASTDMPWDRMLNAYLGKRHRITN